MDTFLYLPPTAPEAIAIKTAFIALACLAAWWVVTVLFLQVSSKHKGDLKVALASFWSTIVVFLLLQVYSLVTLNYNLGDVGVAAMKSSSFLMRFIPEYLVSIVILGMILYRRKSILQSIKLDRSTEAA